MSSVCITVRNVRVRSLSISYQEIVWETESTSEDILDYTFQVLRSEAPAGPFEPISPPMEDQFLFVDNHIRVHNKWRQWHYVIRVTHKASGDYKDFGPVSHSADPDLIAEELRKHFNLLMREFAGRRCWVLPVRTFGQRCPGCFNTTLKSRTRSGCHLCFDTGFVRGYHTPIEAFFQFDPSPKANQQTNLGEVQQQNTTGRMGYFPPLKPKDVIIEPENRRWRVTQVSSTQRLRVVVHQEVQLHEIPKGDTEFLLNLNLGTGEVKTSQGTTIKPIELRDLWLAGSRNYSNPHTLEAFERDEFPEVAALYGSTYPTVKT
jgi:hypothetical protein